jgi:type II secretory pathway pseudopilin PulG
MCTDCQAARGHGPGPYPVMTRAQLRESLALLPSWVLAQKAAANRQVIAFMRQQLAAGEEVARMHQEPGLAWLEHQAEAAETCSQNGRPPTTRNDGRQRRPVSAATAY